MGALLGEKTEGRRGRRAELGLVAGEREDGLTVAVCEDLCRAPHGFLSLETTLGVNEMRCEERVNQG